jgi:hypothetical protein
MAGSTMAASYERGYLIAGVGQTTPLLSYRDPATGRVDGFNVAIARQVAKAIFGNENAIKPVAITSAQRKSAIQSHQVDLVADPTTINPATSAGAFPAVEADLTGGISADHASFTASASHGDRALSGLATGMFAASLLMAAVCAWGLAQRIAEYR